MLVIEYKVWSRLLSKVFPGTGWSFGKLKTFIENDNNGIIDLCMGYGLQQIAHTVEKNTRVKDLALIFLSVY